MSDDKIGNAWGPYGGEDKVFRPPLADRQAKTLTALKTILEAALESKKAELERAQVMLARLKHGGGV